MYCLLIAVMGWLLCVTLGCTHVPPCARLVFAECPNACFVCSSQAKGILGIVDYIRRNVVLCIIAAVLVTGIGSWLTSGRADTTRYVLVVDSGSTGTRM